MSWRPPAPASTALVQERARAPKPGARTPALPLPLPLTLRPPSTSGRPRALDHARTHPRTTPSPHARHLTTHTVLTLHFHPHARSTRPPHPHPHPPRLPSRPTTPAPIAAAPSTPAPPANSAVKGSLTRRRRNARHEHSNRRLGNPRSCFGPQPPLRVTALGRSLSLQRGILGDELPSCRAVVLTLSTDLCFCGVGASCQELTTSTCAVSGQAA